MSDRAANRSAYGLALGAGVITLGLAFASRDAALLPGLLLWAAVVQGALALMAGADVAHGRWHQSLRPHVLALHPLLLAFPLAFLAFSLRIDVYPWTRHTTAWLQPGFFIARNTLMLALVWVVAALYARAAAARSPRTGMLAVFYVLAFVASQSLLAFDLVMSFEYPWVSTLLGGYFFVEALYVGAALCAVIAALRLRRAQAAGPPVEGVVESRERLRDTLTFCFGCSLLWVGQFFAQYLVIWYGNIPHEVDYLYRRVLFGPLRWMSVAVLVTLFFVPFVVLLSRSAKTMPAVAFLIAISVATGVLLERLVMLLPVAGVNPVVAAAEVAVLGAAVVVVLRGRLRAGG